MLATLSLLLTIAQTAPPAAAGPPPPSHLALLIGIDEYEPGPEEIAPPPLRGATTDVDRARLTLINRFHFEDSEILVLENKRATHEAIVRSIHDALIERAGPETEVVLWFSGHGSRCPDAHPDLALEAGGLDSTLLAYDSRAEEGDGGYDVTDDEIYSLLRVLCAKSGRVTFVADSCHSGGVTRGGAGAPIRFATDLAKPLDWKRVEPFWPKDVPFLDDDRPERVDRLHCVLLAACTHEQSAHEHVQCLPGGGALAEGAFSHFLLEELDQLQPATTYEQLVRRVGLRLSALYRDQQPIAEGEIDRQIFSNRFGPPPPGFPAVVKPGQWPVRIEAGSLHLVRTGSLLKITDLVGKELGRARVTRTDAVSATAEWLAEPPRLDAVTAARAIELERPRGLEPIRMATDGDAEVESVAARLTKLGEPAIEIVRGTGQNAALSLQRRKDGPVRLVTEPEGVELWSSAAARNPDETSTLSSILADEERFRGLLALAQNRGTIPVSVDAFELDAAARSSLPKGDRAARLVPEARATSFTGLGGKSKVASKRRVELDPTGRNVLELRVRVDLAADAKPAFVAILCVSEDRSVALLHPVPGARDNEVAPGTELRVPIAVFETPALPGLKRVPLDRILVLATEHFVDFTPLVRAGRFQPSSELRSAARGGGGLPDFLSDLLTPLATRGSAPPTIARETFGVAALDLEVVSATSPENGAGK